MSERRLSDLVSVGVLTRTFPPVLVDEVIAGCGRTEQRHRSLPARVMAYFSIGMALHSEGSYEDVLSLLTDGLAWAADTEPVKLPSKSGIFQARARLGFEPLAALFARVARPLAGGQTPGCWLAGRRLVAVDGMCLDVADTIDNDRWFGRPGVNKGERAAFPPGACRRAGGVWHPCHVRRGRRGVHNIGEYSRWRVGRPVAARDVAARRSRVLRVPFVGTGCSDRSGSDVAGDAEHETPSSGDPY